MPKDKREGRRKGEDQAVLNLKIDGPLSNAEVREVVEPSEDAFQTPCTFAGLTAGLSGGALGYVFGFGRRPCHCSCLPHSTSAIACTADPPLALAAQVATGCEIARRALGVRP